MTLEHVETELHDLATHIGQMDRRMHALETEVARLAETVDQAEPLQTPVEKAVAKRDVAASRVLDAPEETPKVIADLKLELAGARKAREAQKRVADAMADERDEAVAKLEKITDAIREAALDDTLVSGGSVLHYIETAVATPITGEDDASTDDSENAGVEQRDPETGA